MSKTAGVILLWIGVAIQLAALYAQFTTPNKMAMALTCVTVSIAMVTVYCKMEKV